MQCISKFATDNGTTNTLIKSRLKRACISMNIHNICTVFVHDQRIRLLLDISSGDASLLIHKAF